MEKQRTIEKTKEYIRDRLEGEGTGHDWWHILRVHKMAIYIGKKDMEL